MSSTEQTKPTTYPELEKTIYLTQLERDDEVIGFLVTKIKNILEYKLGQQIDYEILHSFRKGKEINFVITEREIMSSRRR